MQIIRGLHNIRPHHQKTVLTIGNFDGVHLGHQAVLAAVVEKARQLEATSTVMIFETISDLMILGRHQRSTFKGRIIRSNGPSTATSLLIEHYKKMNLQCQINFRHY